MIAFVQKPLVRATAVALCALLVGSHAMAAPPATALVSGIELPLMDTTVRPQDDLFKFVNGKWLASTVIPADKGSYGAFNILQDRTLEQLHAIIDELQKSKPSDPERLKLANLYASFMDEAALEGKGVKPIRAELDRINALSDKSQLTSEFARLIGIGVSVPIYAGVDLDDKDSSHYAVNLGQSGLGLPDRDYYLQDDARLKSIRDKYPAHVARLLTLAGESHADESAQAVLAIETDLARVQWSRVENRDPVKTYNRVDVAGLPKLSAAIDWNSALSTLGYAGKIQYVIVNQPTYLSSLDKIIADHSLDDWKTYLRAHTIAAYAPYLEKSFVDEAFAFQGTTIQGIPANRPRWKRGLSLVESGMGEALGKIYVARHFPPQAKARMDHLVSNLLAAYRADLDTLDWMGPETRKKALEKLATFMPKIGYPSKWRDYSSLRIERNDLVGNVIRARQFEHDRGAAKLGKLVDRTEWLMTPQTINAYYNPTMNEIVFPAAILQPPFFNFKADDAVNYGAIGAVIGHEISHGFDDQGSQYGADGNLVGQPGWFTEHDLEQFRVRTHELVSQYNAQEPIPGKHVNGELTLGENIADNSGLAIAYKAYRMSLGGKPSKTIDGFTGEQRFYIGWAQAWKEKSREERTMMLLTTDPHSPPPVRARVTVRNQPGFYEAFGVKEGDAMYLPPEKRVGLW